MSRAFESNKEINLHKLALRRCEEAYERKKSMYVLYKYDKLKFAVRDLLEVKRVTEAQQLLLNPAAMIYKRNNERLVTIDKKIQMLNDIFVETANIGWWNDSKLT